MVDWGKRGRGSSACCPSCLADATPSPPYPPPETDAGFLPTCHRVNVSPRRGLRRPASQQFTMPADPHATQSRLSAFPLAASGRASALPRLKLRTARPRRDVPLMTGALAIAATHRAITRAQATESGRIFLHLTWAIIEVYAPCADLLRRPGAEQLTKPRAHRRLSGRGSTNTYRRRPPRGSSLGSH